VKETNDNADEDESEVYNNKLKLILNSMDLPVLVHQQSADGYGWDFSTSNARRVIILMVMRNMQQLVTKNSALSVI